MILGKKEESGNLESFDTALEILKKRYEQKLISLEKFEKQCEKLGKKKEQYLKMNENRKEN